MFPWHVFLEQSVCFSTLQYNHKLFIKNKAATLLGSCWLIQELYQSK